MENLNGLNSLIALDAQDDISARLRELVRDKGAFAANTWEQLISVMRIVAAWAKKEGRIFFPMKSTDLRDYISHMEEKGMAVSTIQVHTSMIAMLHREAQVVSPTSSSTVRRAMRLTRRSALVAGERTGQAVPFRRDDLFSLDVLWVASDRVAIIRNLAFLHVAYSTLLRMSEISRIRVRDIGRAPDGRIILNVGYTKTVLKAGGVTKSLSFQSSERLTSWINMAGLADHPDAFLFCGTHRTNKAIINTTKPLTAPSMEKIFSDAWAALEKNDVKANKDRYTCWTGHSARVGAAQDMAAAGYSVAQIMQEGTWTKPETVMGYIRHIEAQKGAMLDFMEHGKKTN
ncbi:tyrosine-type recombinase/integrase [Serratia silvae]|uniref:Tyrosine-type recombinase/integrase n=2 Tax=Serratia silvae TaxID=2824122 RepID=A0ABT0KHB1_9GAMM|nr:tyrosine-type recombinase/integrase [Serratia silvae]MCL1031413.1 tyrosine-type recombinase/integrase [Serratia silvae]